MSRGSGLDLIGRVSELERMRVAVRVARAADRSVVLLSGEAGIGKSRLLAEVEQSLRREPPTGRSVAVLRGGCVDVGGSLPYLPVIELLEAVGRLAPEFEAAASSVRRALGGASRSDDDDEPVIAPASRAATFQRLRELLTRAATELDVVVVIDDLHWADRSTLDVISFLARRLAGTGVLLLLAYRSDELHRRHPLRPVLADLERQAALDHVRLGPLDPAGVRAQMKSILGTNPDPAMVERVVRLADGNPFHVEELMALADDRGMPPSLREVLDARLDQLDELGRGVVDEAAVLGRQVDLMLLAAVSDQASSEVARGLRSATDARILVPTGDERHYRFRHALLREAVYDDLSLLERMAAHRRVAQVLTDRPELADTAPNVANAERARHWLAARAEPEAFAALLQAARSALTATAWAEARDDLELALALWDRVADPVTVAGSRRSGILELAAEVTWYTGNARAAVALVRRAQTEPDAAGDPMLLGRLAHREAALLDDLQELAAMHDAIRRAHDLVPDEPPSRERVAILSTMGLHALRDGRVRDAAEVLGAAVEMATRIRERNYLAVALTWLAVARLNLGEVDRPKEIVERLEVMLPRATDYFSWNVVTTWLPWVHIGLAEYGAAIASTDRLMTEGRARGVDRSVGAWSLAPKAFAEFWLGRWDDAERTIAAEADYPSMMDSAVYLRSVAAWIMAGRGDLDRARAVAAEVVDLARSGFPEHVAVAHLSAVWVELLAGRPEAALEHARVAWSGTSAREGLVIRAFVLWLALWAAADAATRFRSRRDWAGLQAAAEFGDELRAATDAALASAGGPDPAAGPGLVLALASAEAARLDGSDTPAMWASLADRFAARHDVPRSAMARLREAEALIHGRADPAMVGTAVRAVLELADSMGAAWFRDRGLALGHAARLKGLEAASTPATAEVDEPWGLSRREREVLELLVDGRSNREIGDVLFISNKTVSVHVTHIMDKLGVSRRTEAAMLALRSGIAGRSAD